MRYADGPSVEVETRIDAPIELVWELISDVTVPPRFSAEVQRVEWDEPGATVGVGSTFTGTNRHPRVGEWQGHCTVDTHDPPRAFGWRIGEADAPAAVWRFTIEEDGGSVILRQYGQIGPGPSGLTPALEAMPDREEEIVARRLEEHRHNMQACVDGIRALADGTA